MSVYLIKTETTYRAGTEAEAEELVNQAKEDTSSELSKYSILKRQKTLKGEVVDEWYKVTITKEFNDEKNPV